MYNKFYMLADCKMNSLQRRPQGEGAFGQGWSAVVQA